MREINSFKNKSEEIQEKFHISEDKVMKLMKNVNKGTKENSLAGDLDPNQVSKRKREGGGSSDLRLYID